MLDVQLLGLVDGSLNSLAERLCAGIKDSGERSDVFENLILQAGELQASVCAIANDILQEHGVSPALCQMLKRLRHAQKP